MNFVLHSLNECHGHVTWHVTNVDLKDSTFRCSLNTIDKHSVFQKFFLFKDLENVFQNRLTERPESVKTFCQTQMNNVLRIDS